MASRAAFEADAGRPRARLPRVVMRRPDAAGAIELLLLALVAVQLARLVWAVATPLTPVGAWRPAAAPAADPAALGAFDPFFRLEGQDGQAMVTSLDLKLYGVREDRASGRGSAIIATPDGRQSSFGVGEEIMPGVRLVAVGFDSVTIDHQGRREQIFLDQSTPAPAAGGEGDAAQALPPGAPPRETPPPPPREAGPPPPQVAPPPPSAAAPIQFEPRTTNGRVSGIAVAPGGDGQAFRAAGFAPGDVIVSVNGQRVSSMEQARNLIARAGGEVNVVVDRGGRAVPMRVRVNP